MGYYTYHGDGYANAYRDTRDNIRIIREQTGMPTVPIHVIGGDAAKSSEDETMAYVRAAARERGARRQPVRLGDHERRQSWAQLTNVRFNPRQSAGAAAGPALRGAARLLRRRPHAPQGGLLRRPPGRTGDRVLHFRLFDVQADEVRLRRELAGRAAPSPPGRQRQVERRALA